MATIKDIATKTGLSVGTVSRVMNNRGYISEETRDKVTEAMKSLNYKPNELARSLTKKNTNMLGIIMPHIEHPYFSRLISRLERAASKYGYKILLCNTRENFEREKDYIDMCLSNRVSGIIICSSSVRELELATTGIPVVVMEKWLIFRQYHQCKHAGRRSFECFLGYGKTLQCAGKRSAMHTG